MSRRRWLGMLGLGAGAGVLGTLAAQNACGPGHKQIEAQKLPINFRKVEYAIEGGDTGRDTVQNSVILTERAGNKLAFTGKDTHEIKVDELFSENATTEIHMLDPRQHPDRMVIDTPQYARTDRQNGEGRHAGPEKDRVHTDLCLHPSILANYIVSADSVFNGRGSQTQDVILHFDPKPNVNIANLTPFEIAIKGQGVDSAGAFTDKNYDQAGIDQIKIVDSRGQVIESAKVSGLSSAREFSNVLATLQVAAERSNDANTPMSVENTDNLVHYAGRRFQDLSHSMGEGRFTRRTPNGAGNRR